MKGRHILLANVFFAPFSYGGATIVAEQVAQALIRQTGCRISAVSLCSRSDLAPYALIASEKDGIINYLINVPHGRSYAETYNNPQITTQVAKLIDRINPDLMHVHCVQDLGAGILDAAQTRNVPMILSVHDFWWLCERQFMIRMDQRYCNQNPVRIENCAACVENFSDARFRLAFLQRQASAAALVTYPSHFAKTLSEASGFAVGQGVVWENGVNQPGPDFPKRHAQRRALDDRIAFGFLGGPSQIKGWPLIQKTFRSLNRDDFKGYLVDGSMDGSWWQDHDLTQLHGDWEVHPRFDQAGMDAFYTKIDVLLFMSQWKETFGLAIREAVARGIRVIQTDSGGTIEHPAVDPAALIPIGGGTTELKRQINGILDAGHQPLNPLPTNSFDDQARQFADFASPLMHAAATD